MRVGDKIERIIFGTNVLSVTLFIFGGLLPDSFIMFYPVNYWKLYLPLCIFTFSDTILKSEYNLIKVVNVLLSICSILLYIAITIINDHMWLN